MSEKNKIAVVLPCNIIWAPYYRKYEEIFAEMGIPFDLIMWNRNLENEEACGRIISYDKPDHTSDGNANKIWKFFKFARFAKKTIKKNQYTKIIFLGTYAGNAVFLAGFLSRNYRKKYWIDIRDHTYEKLLLYRKMESKVVRNSYQTVISSYGFKYFLPLGMKYLIAHNIDHKGISFAKDNEFESIQNETIKISYIGNYGDLYKEETIKFVNYMSNDDRFLIQFFGTGTEELKQYCKDNGICNVYFEGRFEKSDLGRIYGRTDVIDNLYGAKPYNLKIALSNRLYYSLALKKPILVCPGTEMERITKVAGNGFSMDYKDDTKEKLIEFVKTFNRDKCEIVYDKFCKEESVFLKNLKQFIIQ